MTLFRLATRQLAVVSPCPTMNLILWACIVGFARSTSIAERSELNDDSPGDQGFSGGVSSEMSADADLQSSFKERLGAVRRLSKSGLPIPIPRFGVAFSSPPSLQALRPVPGDVSNATLPPGIRQLLVPRTPPPTSPPAGPLPDVSVLCTETELSVRVKKAFYGFGASSDQLLLGPSCRSNGAHHPSGDLLFTYPLVNCGSKRFMPPGYLIYKMILRYQPKSSNSPIRRAHLVNVDIECRYKRYHHVYQVAVRPTWHPAPVKILQSRAGYEIRSMNAAWTASAPSNVYSLGQVVNFQVVGLQISAGEKIYIESCVATMSEDPNSSPRYMVIDNYGCMVDSKVEGSGSKFISPRTDDTINFSIDAFQFSSKPTSEIYLHCKLFIATGGDNNIAKSCTYNGEERRWKGIEPGNDPLCACCDSTCLAPGTRSKSVGVESSGPLLVTDQASLAATAMPKTEAAAALETEESQPSWDDTGAIWFEAKADAQPGPGQRSAGTSPLSGDLEELWDEELAGEMGDSPFVAEEESEGVKWEEQGAERSDGGLEGYGDLDPMQRPSAELESGSPDSSMANGMEGISLLETGMWRKGSWQEHA
ncbi:zona pellucida sperm-binding protein 3-like [Lepisosteus oculatus]|uniref:zona pellucida sperm-binding protein 3-like n=1 Tax=Lepisosteus oculatus TaxID=7918 RepID=UPI0035F520A2